MPEGMLFTSEARNIWFKIEKKIFYCNVLTVSNKCIHEDEVLVLGGFTLSEL